MIPVWLVLLLVGWCVAGVPLAYLIGPVLALAAERDTRPLPPQPSNVRVIRR